jgi:hypothetical protein
MMIDSFSNLLLREMLNMSVTLNSTSYSEPVTLAYKWLSNRSLVEFLLGIGECR